MRWRRHTVTKSYYALFKFLLFLNHSHRFGVPWDFLDLHRFCDLPESVHCCSSVDSGCWILRISVFLWVKIEKGSCLNRPAKGAILKCLEQSDCKLIFFKSYRDTYNICPLSWKLHWRWISFNSKYFVNHNLLKCNDA